MWKIRIVYSDKSKITLTGKQKDISYRLAIKYYNAYVKGRCCTAKYQRYPKKDYPEIYLDDKLAALQKNE